MTVNTNTNKQLSCVNHDTLSGALINCGSVTNETQEIQVELMTNNLDVCVLTETWIKEDDNVTPVRLCPNGYKSLPISRLHRTGGGITIVFKKDLNVTKACTTTYTTMEMATFWININNCVINLVSIYRPPDTNILDFCHEFTDILEQHINQSGELVLTGDFNIAVNKPFDPDPSTFLDTLDSFNLVNKIDEPTHQLSNMVQRQG